MQLEEMQEAISELRVEISREKMVACQKYGVESVESFEKIEAKLKEVTKILHGECQ